MAKRSFDLDFKLKVVEYSKSNGVTPTARKFNINRRQVQKWGKQESTLLSLMSTKNENTSIGMNKRYRLLGGGRTTLLPQLDSLLLNWILEQQRKSLQVSRRLIREEAIRLYSTLDSVKDINFKASPGWLEKFLARNKLSLQQMTKVELTRDTTLLYDKLVAFIMFVSQTVQEKKISPSSVIAMDETSLWFDTLGKTTVTSEMGNERVNATVVLAAKGDGTKLKPFVVFANEAKELKDSTEVIVRSSDNGCMNDDLIADWLESVYTKCSLTHRLLVWDSSKSHVSEHTKQHIKEFNTTMAVVPGGCTKFIQVSELGWNEPFKTHITELYDLWLADNKNEQHTNDGKSSKVPSHELMLEWVKSAWDSISSELLVKSFKSCALTTAFDGSEDDQIYCLREDLPTKDKLKRARESQSYTFSKINDSNSETEQMEILIDISDFETDGSSSDSDSLVVTQGNIVSEVDGK